MFCQLTITADLKNRKIHFLFTCRYDCEEIWTQFEEAVVRQSSCNVTVKDYHPMFNAMPQTWPCDRVSKSEILANCKYDTRS